MEQQCIFSEFTKKYNLSKTLRFELKPVGETVKRMEEFKTFLSEYKNANEEGTPKGIIAEDYKRADEYKKAKKIIDEYHKVFIDDVLIQVSLPLKDILKDKSNKVEIYGLETIYDTYCNLKRSKSNNEEFKKTFIEQQKSLRNYILSIIKQQSGFKHLFAKEFIDGGKVEIKDEKGNKKKVDADSQIIKWLKELKQNTIEPSWLETLGLTNIDAAISVIKGFKGWTTYFSNFFDNRKNIYSNKDIPTSIIYRVVHDNMPKFFDNIQRWKKIRELEESIDFEDTERIVKEIVFTTINTETGEILEQQIKLDDVFNLNAFNLFLNQTGIDKYNLIIGGKFNEGEDKKQKGVNEIINLFTLKQKTIEDKKKIKSLKMTRLFKQILSDRESHSFTIDKFENDKQVIENINMFYKSVFQDDIIIDNNSKSFAVWLNDLFNSLNESCNLEQIHIKDDDLDIISKRVFGNFKFLKRCLNDQAILLAEKETDSKTGKLLTAKQKEKWIDKWTKRSTYAIKELEEVAIAYYAKEENIENTLDSQHPIVDYFKNFKVGEKALLNEIQTQYTISKDIFKNIYEQSKEDSKELIKPNKEENAILIKEFLDSIKNLQKFLKPFDTHTKKKDDKKGGDEFEKDAAFYSVFDVLYEILSGITPLYNKVRNYITQKPYSTEKFKLNFENPTLLDGWPVGREKATSSLIFEKEGYYYLGILNHKTKSNFNGEKTPIDKSDSYNKMFYNQVANPGKDVQNLMIIDGTTVKKNGRKNAQGINEILENLKNEYLPTEINRIRKEKTYSKQSESFNRKDLNSFIEYYKARTVEYFNQYDFEFYKNNDYRDFSEFTDHINAQGYQIKFKPICKNYIEELVQNGDLFLFQIYSKDFSKHSTGKPNLHTLYWKHLFSKENLKDIVYKLNGKAELFYRERSIENASKHEKGDILKYKQFSQTWKHKLKSPVNKKLTEKDLKEHQLFKGYNIKLVYDKTTNYTKVVYEDNEIGKVCKHDIVKDKRFTDDRFFLHCSITQNFAKTEIPSTEKSFKAFVKTFNTEINQTLKDNKDKVHILSIDRGERHLAYYTLLNPKGEIIKQGTLNTITNKTQSGKEFTQNYHDKLTKVEGNRDEARKNWKKIENIKELKEGYLSQVVHKIAQMVIEYNAIVVFEDLNFGFKQGRAKVEKQVYQKMEKMLIDKLSYLVFKDTTDTTKAGNVLHAYQLTAPVTAFKDMKKQTGIIFYVPPYHTSKICPATGFVNLLYFRYKSEKEAKDFFSKFDTIRYNKEKDYFEFSFKYSSFTKAAEGSQDKWTVCSYGKRLQEFRNSINKWDTKEVDLNNELKSLFQNNNISFENGENIKTLIVEQGHKNFFEELMRLLKLTLQMRNSRTGTEEDYLISPVANKDGVFFDSRNTPDTMPKDADANGAYHIGLKGMWCLEQLQTWEAGKKNHKDKDGNATELNLAITNKKWYAYAQNFAQSKNK